MSINERKVLMERLEEEAKEIGFEELATRTGIDRTCFYRLFSGSHNPSLESFIRIVRGLGFAIRLEKE